MCFRPHFFRAHSCGCVLLEGLAMRFAMMLPLITLAGLALPPAAAQPAAKPRPAAATTLAGNWAGDGFSLRVIGADTMVQGKCMGGKIARPIPLDGNGRFAATGYLNKIGANMRLSESTPKDRPAQFSGKISGNMLELQVKSELLQGSKTYRLRRNAAISFDDCGRSVNFRFGKS